MKKRYGISDRLVLILFTAAVVFSLVAVYFSVYADTGQSDSNIQYFNYYFSSEPAREARVGIVVSEEAAEEGGGVQNGTS